MEATPERAGFPDAVAVPTSDPEVQRLRAAVEAKLLGEPPAPVRVGRFVILERVGHGAMGTVYAGYDAELDRKVAIKVLHRTRDDAAVRVRLMREAQAMARLSHPNVVGVFEIGEHEGCGFVAMEFVRGRTLRAWQEHAPRGAREILACYRQAAQGLAAAHAAGVVHRDFKPDNVLVDDVDRVRVVDFGLAHTESGAARDGAARPAWRVGTPSYMAPEQILGEPTDARSDQFAFCVALWEALVGARPFAGDTTEAVFEAVLTGAIVAPKRGVLAPWIEAALRRGLATQAEQRHASMDALVQALDADPRRRRRRAAAIALVVAAVPTILAGVHLRSVAREQGCAVEAAGIDGVWNADAQDRVRDALLATQAANASTAAERSIHGLSEYAEGWRLSAAATCRAVEIDRTADAEVAERMRACLSERLEGVRSLIDGLASADAGIVDRAVVSVLQLPKPERCTDERALAMDLRPPADPTARAELRRIEGEVAGAESLRRLGRSREALARLEGELDAARALDWPSIEARIQFRMGQLLTNLDGAERARELGERAFFSAYRAGDDATAAMSASLLTHVLAVMLARASEATLWDELAEAALVRTGGDYPQASLFHATTQGRRWLIAGDLDRAEAALKRALVLGEEIYGAQHPFLGDPLLVLGTVQCRREAHAACLATHERAYGILSAALGDDHPWTARALAGLGMSAHRAGDDARALEWIDAALAIDERHFGPDNLNVAVDLSYGATVLDETGEPAAAVARLQRARAIMEATYPADHPEVALLLANLGNAQLHAGDHPGARMTLERALGMTQRSATPDASTRSEIEAALAELDRVGQGAGR